jgi:hypothetical protein
MAKSNADVTKKYPDLSGMFAMRDQARLARAKEPPVSKLQALGELQELSKILKSAKIIKKGGIQKD